MVELLVNLSPILTDSTEKPKGLWVLSLTWNILCRQNSDLIQVHKQPGIFFKPPVNIENAISHLDYIISKCSS